METGYGKRQTIIPDFRTEAQLQTVMSQVVKSHNTGQRCNF